MENRSSLWLRGSFRSGGGATPRAALVLFHTCPSAVGSDPQRRVRCSCSARPPHRSQTQKELREAFGVDDDRPIILSSAKFQRRKCPDDLIHAAARLNRDGLVFAVAMVGSGEMEAELRALAADLGVTNVHFRGFVNQSVLPRIYAACDIFVLPSQDEPWGLAINEAMCAGLPIIVSGENGCVPDLVRDGVNGLTFKARDIDGLTGALRRLLCNAQLRQRMGVPSRHNVAGWSHAECRNGLQDALASIGLIPSSSGGQQFAPVPMR